VEAKVEEDAENSFAVFGTEAVVVHTVDKRGLSAGSAEEVLFCGG